MSNNGTIERIASLTAEDWARLSDEEVAELDRYVLETRYDDEDARCSNAKVDANGWASETCGPLYWMQNLTKTIDDHAVAKGSPLKMPFPRQSYFQPLMGALLKMPLGAMRMGECCKLFIPKSRDMMTSWTVCGYIAWLCQWRPGTLAVIQTLKEEKSSELVRYITILAENQEPFLQQRHPLEYSTRLAIGWQNGSRVFGIPGGEHQIRMYHPTVVVFDEMAFMPDAEQCYATVLPVARQIIAVSSAGPGWFGDQCSL